jgi:hypothetical protein
MSHFNARKPLSYYDNFPNGLLKRELGLPSSRSTRSNINYARRHHIILETDFPMSVYECALPKGMGMSLADLQNKVTNQGLSISDKYGKLSKFELCQLYTPLSFSTKNMASNMSPASSSKSTDPVAKEIVAQAREGANAAQEVAKEAAKVAVNNPSDSAALSAANAAQQVANVAAKAVDTVIGLVEKESTAAAATVATQIEKLADASTDLVEASVKEAEAHESTSVTSSQEATENVVIKEEKAQEALNNLTEIIKEVDDTKCNNLKSYYNLRPGQPISVEKFRQLYDSDETMTRNEIKTCLKNNNISYRSKANEDVDYDLSMFNNTERDFNVKCDNLKKYNKLESGHPITVEKFRQLYDSDEAMTRNEINRCLKNNNISYRSKANEDVDYDLSMFNDAELRVNRSKAKEEVDYDLNNLFLDDPKCDNLIKYHTNNKTELSTDDYNSILDDLKNIDMNESEVKECLNKKRVKIPKIYKLVSNGPTPTLQGANLLIPPPPQASGRRKNLLIPPPPQASGRRKSKSLKNRSKCKDKRKYFPKTKMSCKKRRMTWNRKSKRCNIKNM